MSDRECLEMLSVTTPQKYSGMRNGFIGTCTYKFLTAGDGVTTNQVCHPSSSSPPQSFLVPSIYFVLYALVSQRQTIT